MRLPRNRDRLSGVAVAAIVMVGMLLPAVPFGIAAATPSPEDSSANLRKTLNELTREIDTLRSALRDLRTQERTLSQELDRLSKEIQRTELSIARSEQAIAEIEAENALLEKEIGVSEANVARLRTAIASAIRDIAYRDETTVFEMLFSEQSFSSFADELAAQERLERALLEEIEELRALTRRLRDQEEALRERRREEEEVQRLLVMERDELRVKRGLREMILQETKGREEDFAAKLQANEANAARIRTALYLLADLGKSIPFGDAYAMAKPLAEAVGIRPALLLAVLQKESRLGALVGTGVWRTDMHPRDWPAFLKITGELGLDPDTVPVSRKPSYGWGGAMGPAQFLPSTWLGYRDRIAAMTGNHPPSPWNIHDAFAAAALKLAQDGAGAKTPEAEWRAAMIYFAGGNWQNPAYAFYGDAVEDLAAFFQEQITILEQSGQQTVR